VFKFGYGENEENINSTTTIRDFGEEKIIKMISASENAILFLAGKLPGKWSFFLNVLFLFKYLESGKVFGRAPGELLGIDVFEEAEEIPIRCMPNMPPAGEEVVDIFVHHNGAYAITFPKLSKSS